MNNKKCKKYVYSICFLLIFFQFFGCSQQNENIKKFGENANYFMGLKMLEQGQEKEAKAKFYRVLKKGDVLFAQRSARKLCEISPFSERQKIVDIILEKFSDDDKTFKLALSNLQKNDEYSKIVESTNNLDLETDDNELIKIRMKTLKEIGSAKFQNEVFSWFVNRPISKEHYQFYRDLYEHPNFLNLSLSFEDFTKNIMKENILSDNFDSSDKIKINSSINSDFNTKQQNYKDFIYPYLINFRIELYKRNYTYTFSQSKNIINIIKNEKTFEKEQLVSDIGKSFLYGSSDFLESAKYLEELALDFKDSYVEFYFWFYAARLYEKSGVSFQKSKSCFEQAMACTQKKNLQDNALWYLLNLQLDYSLDFLIENINQYVQKINNADYFDDFFDSLSVKLLSLSRWNDFYTVYSKIDGYATNDTVAKFAYIFARLSQKKLARGNSQQINNAYERILGLNKKNNEKSEQKASLYYKILAAYQLNLSQNDIEKLLFEPVLNENKTEHDDFSDDLQKSTGIQKGNNTDKIRAAQLLMEGYVIFGFPNMIYEEWEELFSYISQETNFYLADFLYRCGHSDETNTFYTQSLRIASKAYNNSNEFLTKNQMQNVFPRAYYQIIEDFAKEYEISPNVMFALIRSESFFDPSIQSIAGAVGLTQLMEFTAADVARKLKISDYSLVDPSTNVQMGTYYFSELLRRCDNSYMLAFFSYNAGITRVRRWKKSLMTKMPKEKNISLDLFLEILPYTETREYGRKLVSATVMYSFLENPLSFRETVEMLFLN